MSLLPVEEAQARLLAMAGPRACELAPLDEATGRWLARPVTALRDQPWADLSAMDGYAIRFADMPGPWRVTGESAAGGPPPPPLGAGEAIRIFTGAPMPHGTDSVLVQEDAAREGDALRLTGEGPGAAGRHVRRAGSDFAAGRELLAAGTQLGAAGIALAALGGHGVLPLPRRPRISLLSTGSELVPPGAPTPPGTLPSSNAPMLAAMLAPLPCEVCDRGIIADDLPALAAAFRKAGEGADIVVSTGGASVGDHDLVRPALEAAGGEIDFWKIRMRPGKPLICGRLGDAIFLGLPGNPVSAYATAFLFLLPLVREMNGAADPLPARLALPLATPMPAAGGRDEFVRATMTADGGVHALDEQDSAALHALSRADAFIHRPAGAPAAQAGEMVDVLPL